MATKSTRTVNIGTKSSYATFFASEMIPQTEIEVAPGQVTFMGDFLVDVGLAKFKSPERIETVESYPVTRVGKVDRQVLRTQIADILARE